MASPLLFERANSLGYVDVEESKKKEKGQKIILILAVASYKDNTGKLPLCLIKDREKVQIEFPVSVFKLCRSDVVSMGKSVLTNLAKRAVPNHSHIRNKVKVLKF